MRFRHDGTLLSFSLHEHMVFLDDDSVIRCRINQEGTLLSMQPGEKVAYTRSTTCGRDLVHILRRQLTQVYLERRFLLLMMSSMIAELVWLLLVLRKKRLDDCRYCSGRRVVWQNGTRKTRSNHRVPENWTNTSRKPQTG